VTIWSVVMMTMRDSAARHLAAGVTDLDELARLVGQDTGRTPSLNSVRGYRAGFRKHGASWIEAERTRSRASTKRWYAENPEKQREANRRWRGENPARKLLGACRSGSKQRGHECAITVEMIEEMLAPMTCSATGLPLSLEHDGGSYRNPWAPSIDRINPSKGYVPGNVRVVCALYNLARNDFPDEALMTLAKALAARAP